MSSFDKYSKTTDTKVIFIPDYYYICYGLNLVFPIDFYIMAKKAWGKKKTLPLSAYYKEADQKVIISHFSDRAVGAYAPLGAVRRESDGGLKVEGGD